MIKLICETQEEFSRFVLDEFEKSGLEQLELSKKIKKNRDLICHGLRKKNFLDSSRNGIRREILNYLGFDVEDAFSVRKRP